MSEVQAGRRARFSVDLGELKARVLARARLTGKTPSVVIREAVAQVVAASCCGQASADSMPMVGTEPSERIGLRMRRPEAQAFRQAAQRAGLAPAAYVAALVAEVPAVAASSSSHGITLADHRQALLLSSAELASLARDLRRLMRLLATGDVGAARAYRERLEGTEGAIRAHLAVAGNVLAALAPRGIGRSQRPRSALRLKPAQYTGVAPHAESIPGSVRALRRT
jgi:hypothetical protein